MTISTAQLSVAFVELADSLVDEFDIVDFLHGLTERAAEVSGATGVGIILADHMGRARFMAANNESGELMELLQLQSSQGPCLDCMATGAPVVNAELSWAADLWPDFAPRALAAGFGSVHAFPMRLRGEVIGTLNLFGNAETTFADEEVRVVQALADIATIAILQERSVARAEALAEQLQGALNSRVLIEQAKGALAQADGITPAEAFDLLRSTARSTRRSLKEVAETLLADLEKQAGSGD